MNCLDPLSASVGFLGLSTYAVVQTQSHATLTKDPEPAEFGMLNHGRAYSGEWSWDSPTGWALPTTARTAGTRASAIRP